MVRPARAADLPHMAALADLERTEYKQFAPTFWRKAEGAVERQRAFFRTLLERPTVIAPVWDDGEFGGFIIGIVVPPPPVYDPGSSVCVVDDFVVSSPEAWPTVGTALLNGVRERSGNRGQIRRLSSALISTSLKRRCSETAALRSRPSGTSTRLRGF